MGSKRSRRETYFVKLISPLRPGLLEAADGSGFLYLIMPIRLNVLRRRARPPADARRVCLRSGTSGAMRRRPSNWVAV